MVPRLFILLASQIWIGFRTSSMITSKSVSVPENTGLNKGDMTRENGQLQKNLLSPSDGSKHRFLYRTSKIYKHRTRDFHLSRVRRFLSSYLHSCKTLWWLFCSFSGYPNNLLLRFTEVFINFSFTPSPICDLLPSISRKRKPLVKIILLENDKGSWDKSTKIWDHLFDDSQMWDHLFDDLLVEETF